MTGDPAGPDIGADGLAEPPGTPRVPGSTPPGRRRNLPRRQEGRRHLAAILRPTLGVLPTRDATKAAARCAVSGSNIFAAISGYSSSDLDALHTRWSATESHHDIATTGTYCSRTQAWPGPTLRCGIQVDRFTDRRQARPTTKLGRDTTPRLQQRRCPRPTYQAEITPILRSQLP